VLSPEETKTLSDKVEAAVADDAAPAAVARATSAAVLLADTHKRIAEAPLADSDLDALAYQALSATGVPTKPGAQA
jgi:hypothetical protein